MRLTVDISNKYYIELFLDKEDIPFVRLLDFCKLVDCTLRDALDFYDNLEEKAGNLWPGIGKLTELDGDYVITVPQAYALASLTNDPTRLRAIRYLLINDLPKAIG